MTKLLIHLTEQYTQKHARRTPREALGLLSGYVGIACNLLLCIVKFTVGALTGAVSVTADGINNLSDATVNIVTIIGTKLAGKPVDKEHPFGHGRAEYISALIVAFSIFVMSFELGKSAVLKIIHPEAVTFNALYMVLLGTAVLVKLWMAYFNGKLYARTENLNLKAVRRDSLNDCLATLVTMAVMVLAGKYGITWADGAAGLAVAVFVFISGLLMVKDILGPLLGEPPSKELTDRIEEIILDNDLILGVHDLMVHSYGHGRMHASAHAEVPADSDLVTVHEVIDRAEHQIMQELQVDICIHLDPVEAADKALENFKTMTEIIISDYNPSFTFHDIRLKRENGRTAIEFDLVTPFEYEKDKEKIQQELTDIYRERFPDTEVSIHVEHSYV